MDSIISLERKSTFGFTITFILAEGDDFYSEGEIPDLTIPHDNKKIKLRMIKNPDTGELDSIILNGRGFSSEKEALEYAEKIKNSIYLSGLFLEKAFKITELSVREEGILYYYASGKLSTLHPIDSFISKFKEAAELSDKLSYKQSLALELFNMSFFEGSQRAGFISLFNAVEVLAIRGSYQLSDEMSNLLKGLEEKVKQSNLCRKDKNFFLGPLGGLRKESNSEACKNLIEKNLGSHQAEKFESHQIIRNALLHEGKVPENFGERVKDLREIILNLLIEILKVGRALPAANP